MPNLSRTVFFIIKQIQRRQKKVFQKWNTHTPHTSQENDHHYVNTHTLFSFFSLQTRSPKSSQDFIIVCKLIRGVIGFSETITRTRSTRKNHQHRSRLGALSILICPFQVMMFLFYVDPTCLPDVPRVKKTC
eukprot:Lithocolla_globosa_v1_NODE_1181_length_2804_cov_32.701346.p4 type:complete len:132 gc:universal NODE_1181_length_2804_cov_32.701346:1933-1538(-)